MVLEGLKKISGNIEYHIYGPVKDEEYWEKCKEKMKSLPENIKAIYQKEIEPQRVKEVLSKGHVFILPSQSENFGHAIYEALSAGRPVVTSKNTPWNHLQESSAGINVSIDDPEDMVNSIRFFVEMNQAEMEKWSRGAFNYAEQAIDVEEIKKAYKKMFGVMGNTNLSNAMGTPEK